jgi:hypothetical protein
MIKFLVGFVSAVALIIFAGLSFVGLTPLSKFLGTGQKDLGIKVTRQDTQAAIGKVGTQIVALPQGTADTQGFKLEGKIAADFTMDSQEISAHSNNRPWKNYPLKNVQIKINPDGTIESSAILIISKAMPYALGLGYSEQQIKDAMQKYNIPPLEVPIYIKGKGSVENDSVTVSAFGVKVGAINIPGNIVAQANDEAKQVLEDLIRKNSQSFHCQSLTFADGNLHFVGTVAEKEFVVE